MKSIIISGVILFQYAEYYSLIILDVELFLYLGYIYLILLGVTLSYYAVYSVEISYIFLDHIKLHRNRRT